jgi:putative flippase GtrA
MSFLDIHMKTSFSRAVNQIVDSTLLLRLTKKFNFSSSNIVVASCEKLLGLVYETIYRYVNSMWVINKSSKL